MERVDLPGAKARFRQVYLGAEAPTHEQTLQKEALVVGGDELPIFNVHLGDVRRQSKLFAIFG